MAMEDEIMLDMLAATLRDEVKALENRVKELEAELERVTREQCRADAESRRFKESLERILAVSQLALWNGRCKGTGEVAPQAQTHDDTASY